MNTIEPDEELGIIERARKGDRQAFSVLYTAYFSPVYKYIYYRTGSRIEAEDLSQDVFLKAFSSFSRYSSSGTPLLAYLYTIARTTTIDHHRKKRAPLAEEGQELLVPDPADSPEEEAAKREEALAVRKKLALLPDDQQEAVSLRFIEGLSTAEIAGMMGKTEEAVRQLQSRGLRGLRQKMGN